MRICCLKMFGSPKKSTVLSEKSIVVLAEKLSWIREFDIKNIARKFDIDDGTYSYILEYYKDDTSSSKEAKLQGIFRYLNDKPDKLIGFLKELIQANPIKIKDMLEMNRYLLFDNLEIDSTTKELIPTRDIITIPLSEEISILEKKLEEYGFKSSLIEYQEGLKAIPKDVVGIVTRFRRFLEELIKNIITALGKTPKSSALENRNFIEDLLQFYNPKRKRVSNFRNVLDGVYGMLSELGTHPPLTVSYEEILFLIHMTIEISFRLLYLYEKQI